MECKPNLVVLLLCCTVLISKVQLLQAHLHRGDVIKVSLTGLQNTVWQHRVTGMVILQDSHGNRAKLCSSNFTENDAKIICFSMGYSQGFRYPQMIDLNVNTDLPVLNSLSCSGNEKALDECPRSDHYNCYHKKTDKDIIVHCSNSWFGPVDCGTEVGIATIGEDKQRPEHAYVTEIDQLTGSAMRSFTVEEREIRKTRMIRPTDIQSAVSFPWTAKLFYYLGGEWHYQCGAAIITDRIVLTLAQCVDHIFPYFVKVGEFDTKVDNNFESWFRVQTEVIHPDYYKNATAFDIAVLLLQPNAEGNNIQFSPTVLPVCLPNSYSPLWGDTTAVLAGWGEQHGNAANISRFLRVLQVPLLWESYCEKHVKNYSRGILCAGFKSGGSDACFWDSGAPLVSKINGRSVLTGLLREPGCGEVNKPSTYVNVQSHFRWIISEIKALLR